MPQRAARSERSRFDIGAYHAAMAVAEDLDVAKFLRDQPKKLFIGGRWVEAESGKLFEVEDPATGEQLATVAEAQAADVDRAVAAARNSFDRATWRDLPPAERAKVLWKVGDMIEERADEFAQLETLDNGMPINDALLFHVPLAAATFRYYAGWVTKLDGATQQISLPGKYLSYTQREPIGVVGQIIPWNFPLLMAAWKLAPALACGNSVVLKPSEETPLTALRIGELIVEAGFPPGVVNIVPGFGPTAGAAIAKHMDVDKVAFTGSTEVGHLIMEAAAKSNLKRLTLELGGKSPNIVFSDADMDQAIEGSHFALFFNQGQCCCAGSRLFVEERCYDEFVAKSVERAKKRKVGDPFEAQTEQGPQVDQAQFEKVMSYIDAGKQQGASLLCGGNRIGDRGYFIAPTVFSEVEDDMKIGQEEIFGPV